jgi:hypothetical protein
MTPDFPAAHRITLPERTTFSGTREPGITRSVYETGRGSSCASIPTVGIPANNILVVMANTLLMWAPRTVWDLSQSDRCPCPR